MKALRFLLFALANCAALHAQFVIDHTVGTVGGGFLNNGQSFLPSDAGDFPTSTAYLTGFTFVASEQDSHNADVPTYVSIYASNLGDPESYVGSSTNTQTWTNSNYGATLSWTFNYLPLDTALTFYAFFSSSAAGDSLITQPLAYDSGGEPYLNGDLFNNGLAASPLDANFSATFAASAIPEPSTTALILGAGGVGLVALRRRRRAAG